VFYAFIAALMLYAVAAIVATGVLLHKVRARLWGRVVVWATLFLLILPTSLIFFYMIALSIEGWHYC